MISDKNTPRLLGATFLFVALVPLISGTLSMTVVGSGSISDILVHISSQPMLMRLSVLGWMVTSSGIIVLSVLLYSVLQNQSKILALIALASWLGEAMFVAVAQLGDLALVPLSQEFVKAGAPANAFYQTLGTFLYDGVDGRGNTILMWFYCTGGILWYYLFYKSRYVPRVISVFGLVVATVGLVGIMFQLLGYEVPIWVFLPILPFELTIGTWLVIKGIKDGSETQEYHLPKPGKVTVQAN